LFEIVGFDPAPAVGAGVQALQAFALLNQRITFKNKEAQSYYYNLRFFIYCQWS